MTASDLKLKLQKIRKVHGAQIETLKQKLSAVNAELQALQTILHCDLMEVENSLGKLNHTESNLRSQLPQLPLFEPNGSKSEPNFQNGNGAEVTAP